MALGAVLAGLAITAAPATAHNGTGKIRGVCTLSNTSGRASMAVTVENLWSESVKNITPSDLLGSSSGSAVFFVQTSPRPVRELLPGKKAALDWKGRFYGDGLLDVSVEVFAEFPDGHIETTGIINCNRLTVGNPNPDDPTNTPNSGQPTPTLTAGQSAATPTSASRPTRTPIEQRPTRTPRLDPTATQTPIRPTATATRVPPTRTPIAQRPTRTTALRPTRTATRTAPPAATPTHTLRVPTATPVPLRPTRTRAADPTPRPTRTPPVIPPTATRTPTTGSNPGGGGLVANCSLRRNIDLVTVTMTVENRTGSDLRHVVASPLTLEPEGGSLFFDRSGPSPGSRSILSANTTATFQWAGRLSPGGTMGFSASVGANGPTGELRTPLIDCGITGSDASNFDPQSFSGMCSIHPGEDGEITVDIRNGSREILENIEAVYVARSTTDSGQVLELRGPAPRNIRTLAPGSHREFLWAARILGTGSVTMQFEARASRATSARISTGLIECSVQLGSDGGNLPDLGVDATEQQQSTVIDMENFPPDHCAVVEGCVEGTGMRKLLRFNTMTPNYGPGDAFIGQPNNNPTMVYSSCHNHYHFQEYADYRLLDMSGNIVARGHKQAFCLVDLYHPPGLGGDTVPQFVDCGFQGISAGWADVYHNGLDCQWIDITSVPSGHYVLEVVINPAHIIKEHNYDNNKARTSVVIP